MQLLRYILFPFTPIYYFVIWVRNKLYDSGIKFSKSYNFPVICVGNLSAGGTGKTPMIEYLIRLLITDYKTATLSRGYGRSTKGYVLASNTSNALMIGDEPFQFFSKYGKTIKVAVSENRQIGISELVKYVPKPEVILLDDALQHRKVKAGLNILLTTYSNLYTDDWVLPLGNLREPRKGAKRAQLIVITKCPVNLSEKEKENIKKRIKPSANQELFFSCINYSEKVIGEDRTISLNAINEFTLITGIANAKPLVGFLNSKKLQFNHLEYKDHYHFRKKDIEKFENNELIITTEKDYMRLRSFNSLKEKLFFMPIEVLIDDKDRFDLSVKEFISKTL